MGGAISIMSRLAVMTYTVANLCGDSACEFLGSCFGREGRMATLKNIAKRLERKKSEIMERLEQEENAESRRRLEVQLWLEDIRKVTNEIQKLEERFGESEGESEGDSWNPIRAVELINSLNDLTNRGTELLETNFNDTLIHRYRGAHALPVPAEPPVGDAFQANRRRIKDFLMNDEESKMGIHGMGGTGKTILVKYIYNDLVEAGNNRQVECPATRAHFITVSNKKGCGIFQVQDRIAKSLKLDLSDEQDELQRAGRLLRALQEQKNLVVILDDIWESFLPEEVGLPVKSKGFKLIMTSRHESVCREMLCDVLVEVKPFADEDAWNLFKRNHNFSPRVELEARRVANECGCLPLGIVTLSTSMIGKNDIAEWQNALAELQASEGQKLDKVYKALMFSYDHLRNEATKQCLIRISLYSEGYEMNKKELAEVFVGEGLIGGGRTRKDDLNRGKTVLNELLDAHLLEKSWRGCVKMHDMVRDMVTNMKASEFMVRAKLRLREIPKSKLWTENLEKVSLMSNGITRIPGDMSPRCPRLSTLILRNNPLEEIPDQFFQNMPALMVLDLSYTLLNQLPSSMSELDRLTVLYLRGCSRLGNLHYLENRNGRSNLQYLDLFHCNFRVDVEELRCLVKLETLLCKFHEPRNFNAFLKHVKNMKSLKYYELYLNWNSLDRCEDAFNYERCVIIGSSGDENGILITHDVQRLRTFAGQLGRFLSESSIRSSTGRPPVRYSSIL